MEAVPLTARRRAIKGRNRLKKLRAQGRIPGVLYGKGIDSEVIDVSERDFEHLVHQSVSENVLVDLTIQDAPEGGHLALIQVVDHHPLSGKPLHIDLHKVDPEEPVTISVPIETIGEAIGVKTSGGTLEHVLFRTRVRALPRDLPPAITIDVTDLQAGHIMHLGEMPLPEGVEALGEASVPVVTITEPRVKAEEPAEEGGG